VSHRPLLTHVVVDWDACNVSSKFSKRRWSASRDIAA
jgi:hypothetical protein